VAYGYQLIALIKEINSPEERLNSSKAASFFQFSNFRGKRKKTMSNIHMDFKISSNRENINM
jgi:CRISPR/Cas system endoribonuclease Cas6 (RAMP superfamily)